MPTRRSILKSLLALPFAPLLKRFARGGDRVRQVEVVELPAVGVLYQMNDDWQTTTTARDDIQASLDAAMVDCGLDPKTRDQIEQEIRNQHGDERAANYRRWSEPQCLRAEAF